MIYTAVKNFERALYFYEIVITTPAMIVSHIMLEAYKKYILVSLLISGKVRLRIVIIFLFLIKNNDDRITFLDC